jgi:hypothetical protein
MTPELRVRVGCGPRSKGRPRPPAGPPAARDAARGRPETPSMTRGMWGARRAETVITGECVLASADGCKVRWPLAVLRGISLALARLVQRCSPGHLDPRSGDGLEACDRPAPRRWSIVPHNHEHRVGAADSRTPRSTWPTPCPSLTA